MIWSTYILWYAFICFCSWFFFFLTTIRLPVLKCYPYGTSLRQLLFKTSHVKSRGRFLALSPWRLQFWYRYLILRSQKNSRKIIPWRRRNLESVFDRSTTFLHQQTLPLCSLSSSPFPCNNTWTVLINQIMVVVSGGWWGPHCTHCTDSTRHMAWGGNNGNQNVAP